MTGSGRAVSKLEYSSREIPSTRRSNSKANHTARRQSRQNRIVPVQEKPNMQKKGDEEGFRRSSRRFRENLSIDTNVEASCSLSSTPATAASTTFGTPINLRDNEDLRSPGIEKTPMHSNEHIPDFITQTDKNGNYITPRSETAIQVAKHKEIESRSDDLDHDPCDTFFDSIRSMCCCLVPDGTAVPIERQTEIVTVVTSQLTSKDKDCNIIRLLPSIHPDDKGKKCLVLDLDETLVHSSFRAVPGADFVIPVQIEDVVHFVYVMKRPGVDNFLLEMSKFYEIIIYTASLNKYADPLLDLLDTHKVVRSRLFRESCVYYEGSYVKDLSIINRDLSQTIIVDNSPNSYIFHPENAIDCSSFIDDPNDRELEQIGACLVGIQGVKDVRNICTLWRDWPDVEIDEELSLKQ